MFIPDNVILTCPNDVVFTFLSTTGWLMVPIRKHFSMFLTFICLNIKQMSVQSCSFQPRYLTSPRHSACKVGSVYCTDRRCDQSFRWL